MPDPVWYYARGEVEKGPFSTSQIKALAAAGKIRPDDFVWKEGMDSWVPASEISEIYPEDESATKEKETDREAATEPREVRETGAKVPVDLPGYLTRRSREQREVVRSVGFLLAGIGFAMVLVTQGCEMVGGRRVARWQAAASAAELEFRDRWRQRIAPVQTDLRTLNQSGESGKIDPAQRRQLTDQLAELQRQMQIEEAELRDTSWRDLLAAAERADVENQRWSYWRGLHLFGGIMLLAGGLIAAAYATRGPERWLCLAALIALAYVVCTSSAFTPGM
jgi:hypothetical protein